MIHIPHCCVTTCSTTGQHASNKATKECTIRKTGVQMREKETYRKGSWHNKRGRSLMWSAVRTPRNELARVERRVCVACPCVCMCLCVGTCKDYPSRSAAESSLGVSIASAQGQWRWSSGGAGQLDERHVCAGMRERHLTKTVEINVSASQSLEILELWRAKRGC